MCLKPSSWAPNNSFFLGRTKALWCGPSFHIHTRIRVFTG